MRVKFGMLGATLATLLWVGPSALAATVFPATGTINLTTPFLGVNAASTQAFVAEVNSAAYAPGTAPTTYYSALGTTAAASTASNSWVYGYVVNLISYIPSNNALDTFSVFSGQTITAAGTAENGGVNASATFTNFAPLLLPSQAEYKFLLPATVPPLFTDVLLFASAGGPVLQEATVSDGASASNLVLSAGGPLGGGTPVPLPSAAWGGLALMGVMALSRVRKARA